MHNGWVSKERSSELDKLIDAYQVAQLDLRFQDAEPLMQALDDMRMLKPDTDRLIRQASRQRRETCIEVISEHFRDELKQRGLLDKVRDGTSRSKIIDSLNKQLEGLATVRWDRANNKPAIQVHHLDPDDMTEASIADFSQSLEEVLERQSSVAGKLSGALVHIGLARRAGNRVNLVTGFPPGHSEIKDRLARDMKNFYGGMTILMSHKDQIESYVELQKEQVQLSKRVQNEFSILDKKLARKRPLKRKVREKLFQISKQSATAAALGKVSEQLELQQEQLLKMLKTGKLKVSEVSPVLRELHKQLAHSHGWYPAGKSRYQYKESETLPLKPVETALKQTTKPFSRLRRAYFSAFKPEKHKLLKEVRLVVAAGATATASPRVLLREYVRLKESIEQFDRKDKKLQALASSLNDYIENIEEQWPVPTPGGAAAA